MVRVPTSASSVDNDLDKHTLPVAAVELALEKVPRCASRGAARRKPRKGCLL